MSGNRFFYALIFGYAIASASGCSLSSTKGTFAPSQSLQPAKSGRLQQAAERVTAGFAADESAFWLLDRADFSFEARLARVDRATTSLDIQYFIWEKDPSSRLFTHRIVLAADRGVKVRILLDDLTLNGQDGEYGGLNQHQNIEVRTFNPWNRRFYVGRVAEFFMRFGQLNHRMHNKIIVADGHFGVVGGRNIGDRYFGLWDNFVQNDLDVMVTGAIVDGLAVSFDEYWNSEESYPLTAVINGRAEARSHDEVVDFVVEFYQADVERLRFFPLEPDLWDDFLNRIESSYSRGRVDYVYDQPVLADRQPTDLIEPFNEFLEQAQESVLISSPYMIPDRALVDLLERLEGRGVEVVILTNSLATNNHMIAHSAYKRWRRELLRIGVELYEAREDSAALDFYTTPPAMPGFLGLHSKGAVVDGRHSYVGSANIDPRSLVINTELAFFVDSTDLADRLSALIRRDMGPDAAWRVTLEGSRKLRWTSSAGTIMRQPALGLGQRLAEFFVGLLPIKKMA